MGGFGSGSRGQVGRSTTSDLYALDVRQLQREKLLSANQNFGWSWSRNGEIIASIQIRTEADRVILNYRHKANGRDWVQMDYPVWLDWTACHYGGGRAWFRCPASGCGRRVAKLYIGRAGIFACRHCYRLAYASQRENAMDRTIRRAEKIRARLGWEPGVLNGSGWKPKWMRWATFWQAQEKVNALTLQSCQEMLASLHLKRKSYSASSRPPSGSTPTQ